MPLPIRKIFNLALMTTTTTGTGTITLGSAVTGFLSFAGAGVVNGDTVSYIINDNFGGSEVGWGVYTASGTTLTRNVVSSTNNNAAISLSGNAQVAISPLADDITVARPRVKTTTYTASAGETIMADTTSAAWTLSLPASPVDQDTVIVNDAFGTFGTNNLTVSGNGTNIDGFTFTGSASVVLNCPGNNATFVYKSSSGKWKCQQVDTGHWSTQTVSGATLVEFTGLPGGNVNFKLLGENIDGNISDPLVTVGYGATPTYQASGYYSFTNQSGSIVTYRTSPNAANWIIVAATGDITGPSRLDMDVYTTQGTIVNVKGYISWWGWGNSTFANDVTMASSPMTAIKFARNAATTFSGTFHLKWIKVNI